MLAYKEKEKDKPIKVSTNIKRRTKKVNNNRILGSVLIVLALLSLLLPETQEDGTAFIMMIIFRFSSYIFQIIPFILMFNV